MKRMGLHLTNWIGFIVANAMLGRLWGMLFGYLFKGFLSDEAYAANHPKKFFLGTVGIMLLASVSSVVVIYYPLKRLCEFFDKKIEDFADDKEWD